MSKPKHRGKYPSPYLAPGFYDEALATGRHRDIVGGRWEETGLVQMQILLAEGLDPHHTLLDIGAGCLRLGCRAVPYLDAGNYWATDQSRALMLRGREVELADPSRLPEQQLIADDSFDLPNVPDQMDYAIAFGLFTHLPLPMLERALVNVRRQLPSLKCFFFTSFIAPQDGYDAPFRQPDGVVTHPARTPYHFVQDAVISAATAADWDVSTLPTELPRGQQLFRAVPA